MIKMILVYTVRAEARRQRVSLSSLSWKHEHQETRFLPSWACPEMTVWAPCVLMLGLEISLQNRKSAYKEDRPEFYALFLFFYLSTVASGTIEGKQVY